MKAIRLTREKGTKTESKFSLKTKNGSVFELHLDPKDEAKIFYFNMKVEKLDSSLSGTPT